MVTPDINALTFQDGLTHVQLCHPESPGTEESGLLERRMAVGKPSVKSMLVAGSVHKAGSAQTPWASSPHRVS